MVIYVRTVDGIWHVVMEYMPGGSNIREIFMSCENFTPSVTAIPTYWYSLKYNAEVLAFLQVPNSQPIRLLVLLHWDAVV